MTSAPSTAPDPDLDTDEDESSWTDFVLPVVFFALAAIPFTPFWDHLTDPDENRRKYRAASEFLASVGPVPVTLVFAGIGAALLCLALVQRSRSKAAVTAADDTEG